MPLTTARPWLIAVLLGLLTLSPAKAAGDWQPWSPEVQAKAEKGDAQAQYILGNCYGNGLGVAKDKVEAVKWYRKAADQGLANAQFWLGVYYADGNGVAKDQVQAVSWWRKAAVQGYDMAQMALAGCYANGTGVAKDQVQAVKWTRKGAEQGNVACLEQMGEYYAYGLGVTKNLIEAYAYLSLAGITYEHARQVLTAHEKMMSAVQIAAGKNRAIVLQKEIDAKKAAKQVGK